MIVSTVDLVDPGTGASASIAPALGFNCFSFKPVIAGEPREVLWHDPEFRSGNTRPSRSGIPILFPFAGRIRNGRYRYRGRDYELEAADGRGNAIHGFVYTRPWRVIEQSATSVTGEFQASIDDPSILDRWPSNFRIRATYALTPDGTGLVCRYAIANTGDSTLPWWFGTHPYFRLALEGSGANPADAVVAFSAAQQWELADLIPTGRIVDVPDAAALAAGLRIGEREFDNAYTDLEGRDGQGNWVGEVRHASGDTRTEIIFGPGFRECVVFIPPHREAICLEPYTGVPNAFELQEIALRAGSVSDRSANNTGLAELPPGGETELRVTIRAAAF
jgi:aldose 1-epimerase